MTTGNQVTRGKLLAEHPLKAMVFSGADLSPRTRIYRYLTWDRAREFFETNKLRLASPRSWVDPYEHWWCDLLFRPSSQLHVANAFACCWSTRHTDEPYWRLYDRDGTRAVVRLGTTVQRIVDALSSAVAVMPAKAFVGRVRYRPTIELERAALRVKIGSEKEVAAVAARMLHMKRSAFQFEQEVRVVWVERSADGLDRHIPLNSVNVFRRVMIGPSVLRDQAASIRRSLRQLGVSPANVKQSLLYHLPQARR